MLPAVRVPSIVEAVRVSAPVDYQPLYYAPDARANITALDVRALTEQSPAHLFQD
jgi:hypothetical protein